MTSDIDFWPKNDIQCTHWHQISIKTTIKTIKKWYCGHLYLKNLQNDTFSIILHQNWRQLTSKREFWPKHNHPLHSKTIKIDKNHHKNHQKVVLCKFKGSKSDILCKNGQKWQKMSIRMTSLWRHNVRWRNFQYHFWNPHKILHKIGYKL